MGITGELVRSVFSKNRSFGTTHDANVMRNNAVERKRWASVRSYLCGDEFNSVLAGEDAASRRSSKAAMNSVLMEDNSGSGRSSKATVFSSRIDDEGSEATVTQPISDHSNETSEADEKTELASKHDAAVIIQSEFRSFLIRHRNKKLESTNSGGLELVPSSKESIATSVEVQTGNSVVEAKEGSDGFANRMQHHKGARSHASKLKQEDWDDSTVSSNISKMRIQNRLEASTRRERALAYAFSQQLRICSKKKQSVRSGNESEANMSWSWLERWMATRQHDTSFGDVSKQFEQLNGNQKLMVKSRVLSDLPGEEKESCGSNEVSMHFDTISSSSKTDEKSYYKPARNRLKATSVSRRKSKMKRQGGGEIRCEG
ncbi:protein IQ-DOMAIN 1 isoform X1 [Cynara cardunculus var. scolymus]|uniref:IQ motif, EF-hand binding site-containing protein n=1 Tax=Cynara cardunculus var. scolymus TaxID=59895 RepID=A0A103YKG7_CYNCS|nr:protein IQ-DOMAIN 1 isoform X1 [Cynara cardunculus var. scolymus]KVI10657.1 IQ motif, EF-hand binding site-containing protein [Cynara cardunculus var. scolymus]